MKNFSTNILKFPFSLLLSLIIVGGVFLIFGFYWQGYEKIDAALLYGNIATPPYEVWYDDTLFLQIPIISYLSDYFSDLPIYGIWHLILIVSYVSLWFHLSLRILNRATKKRPIILILYSHLFVWSLIGFSLVYVHLTGASILLSSAGILVYLDYYIFENKKPVLLIFAFAFGCLMRVSSGILVLVSMTIFYLLVFKDFRKTFHLLKMHWIIGIVCLSIVQIYRDTSDNPRLKIEQNYEYALVDKGAIVPLFTMKTKVDSIRYIALTEYFLVMDSEQINLDFIKKIVDTNQYMALGLNKADLSHLTDTLLPIISCNKAIFLLLYGLLFIIAYNGPRRTLVDILIINLFCWIVIIGFSMKIGMFENFMLPWTSMLFSSSFVLIFLNKIKIHNWQVFLALLISLGLIIIISNTLLGISNEECLLNKSKQSYLNKIEALSRNSTPIIWVECQDFLPSGILSRKEASVFKPCIDQAMFMMMYNRFAQDRFIKKFGSSPLDFRRSGLLLKKNHGKICFVFKDKTANFLTLYYKVVYNLDFKLVKDYPINEIAPDDYVYHLE